jgi:hypothetical protein
MEEKKPPTQENTPITLTLSHDAAVVVAAAATHYRVLLSGVAEMAPAIQQLDEVYHQIVQQPQLSSTSKAFLRDTRLVVAGLKDEGGKNDGTSE